MRWICWFSVADHTGTMPGSLMEDFIFIGRCSCAYLILGFGLEMAWGCKCIML